MVPPGAGRGRCAPSVGAWLLLVVLGLGLPGLPAGASVCLAAAVEALADVAAEAGSEAPGVSSPALHLQKAQDTLGRDISGSRQTVKSLGTLERPLLVQVVDDQGAPVGNVVVAFRIEPSHDEQGELYHNGGLVALLPTQSAPGRPPELVRARGTDEPRPTVTVHTDPQGYAGVSYVAGRHIEVVPITVYLPADPAEEVHFAVRIVDQKWGFLLWSGLLGGLALFLFGMVQATKGLERAAGHRLRLVLSRLTGHRLIGWLVGIVVTALLQSSSATTVMLVSFANAGLMSLGQTLAIILGADVGTTITVQVIAFNLKEYSLLLVFAGFLLKSLRRRHWQGLGRILMGFGLIFYGMALMGRAMDPLRDLPFFREMLLTGAERPALVLLLATLFTALIQSSAATIGIALTFAFQGLIDLTTAIAVILGANIGTCMTAYLASLGTRREAQRVAYAHILFKATTALMVLPLLGPFTRLVAATASDLPRQIANAHTIFNVSAALLFLPLLGPVERRLRAWLPDRAREKGVWTPKYIDEQILESPTLALAQVTREISRMGDTVLLMLRLGLRALLERNDELRGRVRQLDDKVDMLDEALRRYLTRLSRGELTDDQAAKVASLLYLVHHLETIGDLVSKQLMHYAHRIQEQDLRFSETGTRQWRSFYERNVALLEKALAAFAINDRQMAAEVVEAKEEMSRLARTLHFQHLERLGKGIPESEETSELHIHIIADLRRVLSNTVSIAAAVVNQYRIPDQPHLLGHSTEE
jgi:phosphate:Na+ symporter